MDSGKLKPEQIARLKASVDRQLRYLGKLVERMNRTGFLGTDPLFQAALRARNEVQGLSVAIHYASCPKGTAGR